MPDDNEDFPLTRVFFGAVSLPLQKHRLEALAVLLQGGAEPNLHASGTGNTPLHLPRWLYEGRTSGPLSCFYTEGPTPTQRTLRVQLP